MNLSKALETHLWRSAENGSPSAILFAQLALFTATFFVSKTRLYIEHDSIGFTMVLSYQIIAVLVSNSRHLSHFGCIHRPCGCKVNSIANLICLVLAIVLKKFYEISLGSLGFALSITVLLLILLVIIRPSTDLGLFGFLIGVIGSVAYNLFELKFQTWIVVAICFLLVVFRCWLDKNWLEVGEDQSLPVARSTKRRNQISKLEIIEAITVAGFHLFWLCNLYKTNCRKIKGPPESISCTSSSIMGMLACVLIFFVYSSFQRKLKVLLLKWEEHRKRREARELEELEPEEQRREARELEPEEQRSQRELEPEEEQRALDKWQLLPERQRVRAPNAWQQFQERRRVREAQRRVRRRTREQQRALKAQLEEVTELVER